MNMENVYHIPVLLQETVDGLNIILTASMLMSHLEVEGTAEKF